MSCVGVSNIKEEPDWEDYCISEAQARAALAARAVKPEPVSEPLGASAGAPDTNYKADSSIQSQSNCTKSHDTEQNNNGTVNVKEETGESWMQGFPGLYEETSNREELKTPLDLYSVKSEKIETDAESEELNQVPPVFQKPKVVHSRQDLMMINNIAQEVKRKRVIIHEKISRPLTKYVYTTNQKPVKPAKPISRIKPPVFKKVTINPEIGLLSQPIRVANAIVKSNLVSVSYSVKKQPSNFARQKAPDYQEIPLLNSVAYNNPAIPRDTVPVTCSQRRTTESLNQTLPTGIFRPVKAPVSQPLPIGIFQPIKVPISQLNGKVSLKPLEKNPPETTTSIPRLRPVAISKPDTISNLQPGTISKLQPGTISNVQHATIAKLQPGTISNVQHATIAKLQPGTISKVQPDTISSLQPGTISKVQPDTISSLQPGTISKLQPDTISTFQPRTILTLKPNVLNLKMDPPSFITIVSNPFENVKPKCYQNVPHGNKIEKTPTVSALKSNVTATPGSKPTPMMPTNFQRINISKSINSQIPEVVKNKNSLTPKIINGDKQSATQSNSNIQRIAALAPRTFPKPVNSLIAKPIQNHISQNKNYYRKSEVNQNCNIQRMMLKTVPKVSGPVNSQIPKSIDTNNISGSINGDREVVIQNLPPNSKAPEKSNNVVNLEDFLIPSYVVLERMKKRTCKDCEKTFYEHKAFVDHTRRSQKWKKIVSNFRNDGGISVDTTKIDSSPPSLICEYCQKSFSKHYVLYHHVRRRHLCRKRNFHCDYCGKKCLERRHLINHIRTHTGERPHKCLICKTRYRTVSNLASHNINMHGTKQHLCPVCSRPFNMISNMKKHILTHSGERRYVCEICNRKFIQKHHLNRHMESHLDIRRYKCNSCRMRFLRKAHLERHKKTHTKKRSLKKSRKKSDCK